MRAGPIPVQAHRLYALLAACILIYALPVRAADKAADLFDSLYGDAYKAAVASPASDDDIKLAAQLLETANSAAADHPDLLKLLCEKAVELGKKDPDGYPSAIGALNLLVERFPAEAFRYKPQIAELYQAWFIRARGEQKKQVGQILIGHLVTQANTERANQRFDDAEKTLRRALAVAGAVDSDVRKSVFEMLKATRAEQEVHEDIERAKNLLKTNPADAAAKKKLLHAYLVELDQPKEAAEYADADPKAQAMLPLMTGDVEVLSPLAWLDLADWQSELATTATNDAAKANMLRRAHRNYRKFLDRHADKDLSRTKAELASRKIENTLESMGVAEAAPAIAASTNPLPASEPSGSGTTHATQTPRVISSPRGVRGGESINLLKSVDPSKAVHGKWVMQGNSLASVGDVQFSRLALPMEPSGNYELTVEMERAEGDDAATIIIPVAGKQLAISLGWKKGGKNSLEFIGGPRKTLFSDQHNLIKTGQRHAVVVRVVEEGESVGVAILLDGRIILEWQGRAGDIYTHKKWTLPNKKAIGIGAQKSTWGFHRVELKTR